MQGSKRAGGTKREEYTYLGDLTPQRVPRLNGCLWSPPAVAAVVEEELGTAAVAKVEPVAAAVVMVEVPAAAPPDVATSEKAGVLEMQGPQDRGTPQEDATGSCSDRGPPQSSGTCWRAPRQRTRPGVAAYSSSLRCLRAALPGWWGLLRP
jgi:hypothetical protein